MAALPYIQLYVADYLADTIHLTTEEHGAYLLLIMNYWQTGKPIPKDRVESITKLNPTDVQRVVNDFFIEDDKGGYFNQRIEQDLKRVKRKSKQASEAGKRSAEKRQSLKTPCIEAPSNGRSTDNKSSLNHTYTYTDTDTDTEKQTTPLDGAGVALVLKHFRRHKKGSSGNSRARNRIGAIIAKGKHSIDDLKLSIDRHSQEASKQKNQHEKPGYLFWAVRIIS